MAFTVFLPVFLQGTIIISSPHSDFKTQYHSIYNSKNEVKFSQSMFRCFFNCLAGEHSHCVSYIHKLYSSCYWRQSQFLGLLHIHAILSTHTPLNWVRKGEKEMQSHIQITTARKIPKRHILKWHSWLGTSHGFVKQDCCKLCPHCWVRTCHLSLQRLPNPAFIVSQIWQVSALWVLNPSVLKCCRAGYHSESPTSQDNEVTSDTTISSYQQLRKQH